MSEAKHTPGPWEFCLHDPHSQWFGNIIGVYGVVDGSKNIRTITCQTKYGTLDECEANARLIASAPDLLDTLDRIATGEFASDVPLSEQVATYRTLARAAIAKAKGK